MWLLLKTALSFIWSSPIVRAVALSAISDLREHGEALVPVALNAIKSAINTDVSGTQKAAIVRDAVLTEVKGVPVSLANTVIESTYRALIKPEIPVT